MSGMVNRLALASATALLLLVSVAGCKNNPENVCKRFTEMMAAKLGKQGLLTREDKARVEADCTKEMEEDKERNPNKYECTAKCINGAKDVDDLDPCLKKCPKDG